MFVCLLKREWKIFQFIKNEVKKKVSIPISVETTSKII